MDPIQRKKRLQRLRKEKQRAIAKIRRNIVSSSDSEYDHYYHERSAEEQINTSVLSVLPVQEYRNEDICNDADDTDNGEMHLSDQIIDQNRMSDSEDCRTDNIDITLSNADELCDVQRIEDINIDEEPEILQLQKWAIKCNIPHSYIEELLIILRPRLLPSLPKNAKTFLHTVNCKQSIIPMEDQCGGMGEFVYFGLENELKERINPKLHKERLLELQINVDPVPLTKSSNQQFTPILCKIHETHAYTDIYEVFPVAIFYGQAKPKTPEIFLDQFIHEMNKLLKDGIIILNIHFKISLKCFICDTPARAFLKNTVGHGGKFACERCQVEGSRISNRMVYPDVNADERNNINFRNKTQPGHHHDGFSPLLKILPELNIISCFVLDFMHLVCIGIVKKLLEYWLINGNLNFRLNRQSRIELSRRMEYLKNQVPCEFQRKPRSTNFVSKWKATEFRFFLLYCGPIVLKGILRRELYDHFLLMHTACRILCCEKFCIAYQPLAKQYLRSFFICLKDYYGPESQILNAHHLIHLADDVQYIGCSLNRFTAFPFESYLGKLKKFLRTANRPLAQLTRRIHEAKSIKKKNEPTVVLPLLETFPMNGNEIKKIRFRNVTISNSSPDNMVALTDNTIVRILKFFWDMENLMFEGLKWKTKKSIYTYPSDSMHFGMWEMENQISQRIVTLPVNKIAQKLVKLTLSLKENGPEKSYVVPFIH